MTRHRLSDWLSIAMKVSTIVALVTTPVVTYVGVSSKVAVIERRLDEQDHGMQELHREMMEYRTSVVALELTNKDLAVAETLIRSDIDRLKAEGKKRQASNGTDDGNSGR